MPLDFPLEVVLTTVLSLMAASLWNEWIKEIWRNYFSEHLTVLFLMAVAMTVVAISVLRLLLATKPPPSLIHAQTAERKV